MADTEAKTPAAILDSLSGAEIKQLAALLAKMGEKGDTILAHITPEEAAMLKANGGSGEPNPTTGLPAFNDGGDNEGGGDAGGDNEAGGTDAGVGGGDDGPGSNDASGGDDGGGAGEAGGDGGGDAGASNAPGAANEGNGPGGEVNPPAPAPPPAAATPEPTPAEVAKPPAAAVPDEASMAASRYSRRATARNSRANGVTSLRSDLLIGGVTSGSSLTIPR